MNTLKNFAFGMCLCGTFGLGLTLLGSCTSSGGKTETVMSDSVDAEQGNAVVEAIMSRRPKSPVSRICSEMLRP